MNPTTRERPIIFSAPMVRAILAGHKTQTRRVVKPQPRTECVDTWTWSPMQAPRLAVTERGLEYPVSAFCPYGQPGDRLWVREAWRPCQVPQHGDAACCVEYRASDYCKAGHLATLNRTGWKPSIHMPRWASRLILEVVDVRAERLQAISEDDAIAEGIKRWIPRSDSPLVLDERGKQRPLFGVDYDRDRVADGPRTARDAFALLWDSINAKRGYSWESNPWAWVVAFKLSNER